MTRVDTSFLAASTAPPEAPTMDRLNTPGAPGHTCSCAPVMACGVCVCVCVCVCVRSHARGTGGGMQLRAGHGLRVYKIIQI